MQFWKTFPSQFRHFHAVAGQHGTAFWGSLWENQGVLSSPWHIRAYQGFGNDKCVEVICISKLGEQCLLFTQLLCWGEGQGEGGRGKKTLPRSICNANEAYLERLPGLFISVPGEPAEEEEERRSASFTGLLSLLFFSPLVSSLRD